MKKKRSELEKNKTGVEDRPDEEHMDQNIGWIAVIRAVESEVVFQIKQAFRHGLMD